MMLYFLKNNAKDTNVHMSQLYHYAEREAEDADGARDRQAEGPRRGVRDGAEGVEGAAQAQETGKRGDSRFTTVFEPHFDVITLDV